MQTPNSWEIDQGLTSDAPSGQKVCFVAKKSLKFSSERVDDS